MKSVKSLIDRRQEIEQQLHAIAMRQPPSQTVASPEGHLVIHAPFDIQDLKKRVRLKSQLAQIDLKLGPAKPVKKSVPQRTTTITNGGSELLTEQLLAQRWFCSTSRLQRWRMDEKGPSYLKIGGKVLSDWKMCDLTSCHAGSKPQPVHDKYKPFRKYGTATVLPSKSASNPLISLGIFLGVCFSYRLGMETSPFLKK